MAKSTNENYKPRKYSWGGGIAIGGILGGYLGYKIGRARPQKFGFDTERKIGQGIKKTFSKKKKMARGGGVEVAEKFLGYKKGGWSENEWNAKKFNKLKELGFKLKGDYGIYGKRYFAQIVGLTAKANEEIKGNRNFQSEGFDKDKVREETLNKFMEWYNSKESYAKGGGVDKLQERIKYQTKFYEQELADLKRGKRKTINQYYVQGNYGYGWDDLTSHNTRAEANMEKRTYDENESYPHRVVTKRIKKADFESGNYAKGGGIDNIKFTDLVGKNFEIQYGSTGVKRKNWEREDLLDWLKGAVYHNLFDSGFYYSEFIDNQKEYNQKFKETLNIMFENVDKVLNDYFVFETTPYSTKEEILVFKNKKSTNREFIDNWFKTNKNISNQLRSEYKIYRENYAGITPYAKGGGVGLDFTLKKINGKVSIQPNTNLAKEFYKESWISDPKKRDMYDMSYIGRIIVDNGFTYDLDNTYAKGGEIEEDWFDIDVEKIDKELEEYGEKFYDNLVKIAENDLMEFYTNYDGYDEEESNLFVLYKPTNKGVWLNSPILIQSEYDRGNLNIVHKFGNDIVNDDYAKGGGVGMNDFGIGDKVMYDTFRDGTKEGEILREIDDNHWEIGSGFGVSMVNKDKVVGFAPKRRFGLFEEGGNIDDIVTG